MKQDADKFTADMLSKPGRGRTRKIDAKSPAQRMREYRARVKFNFLKAQKEKGISVTRYGN